MAAPSRLFGLLTALALSALLVTTQSVAHNTSESAALTGFPNIEVTSAGNRYVGLSRIAYQWDGRINLNGGSHHRVKRWEIYPLIQTTDSFVGEWDPSLLAYSAEKSYGVFKRPKKVNLERSVQFPDVVVKDWAIEVCENHAEKLRSEDMQDAIIFAYDRHIPVEVIPRLLYA